METPAEKERAKTAKTTITTKRAEENKPPTCQERSMKHTLFLLIFATCCTSEPPPKAPDPEPKYEDHFPAMLEFEAQDAGDQDADV